MGETPLVQSASMGITILDTPCREYQGSRTIRGYGRRNRRQGDGTLRSTLIHRWIWEQVYGPIPDGMIILHRCDNPPCFRLDHLELGTQTENLADMRAKGRSKTGPNAPHHEPPPKKGRLKDRTHCVNGHEYTPENTCLDRRGWRSCRKCRRESDRRRRPWDRST